MVNLNREIISRDSQIDELTENNRILNKDCFRMQESMKSEKTKITEILIHATELYEKS